MSAYTGPIAFEGRPTLDGRLIDHLALDWDTPLPVYAEDRTLLGLVAKIRRETTEHGDVALVADVVFDVPQEGETLPCGIELADVEHTLAGAHQTFTTGRIGALVVYTDASAPAWAGARLTRTGP